MNFYNHISHSVIVGAFDLVKERSASELDNLTSSKMSVAFHCLTSYPTTMWVDGGYICVQWSLCLQQLWIMTYQN